MLVLIRGAGDIASGIALRLYRAGFSVVMTDLERPTAIRRTVCFSQAILLGQATVEDVTARAASLAQVESILANGEIPVLADPQCRCREALRPDVLVGFSALGGVELAVEAAFGHQLTDSTPYRPETVLAGKDGWNPVANGNRLIGEQQR